LQTQTLNNIEAILKAAGSDLGRVVKLNIYLKGDYSGFAAMNEVYLGRFAEPMPARTAVAVVDLPFGALIEMECVAEYD
jgi:2-iminobutanoate/2-iminopropanoate deaminase